MQLVCWNSLRDVTVVVAAVVMDEQVTGLFTNHLLTSDNASHYVTWCSEPQEKVICLWAVVEGRLTVLGSFTPDDKARWRREYA